MTYRLKLSTRTASGVVEEQPEREHLSLLAAMEEVDGVIRQVEPLGGAVMATVTRGKRTVAWVSLNTRQRKPDDH